MKSCLALILLFVCGCAESPKKTELKIYPYEDGISILPWGVRLDKAEATLRSFELPFSTHVSGRWRHLIDSYYVLDTMFQDIPSTKYSAGLSFVDSVLVRFTLLMTYKGDYERKFFSHVTKRFTERFGSNPTILSSKAGTKVRIELDDRDDSRYARITITAEDVLRLAEESAARKDADPSRL